MERFSGAPKVAGSQETSSESRRPGSHLEDQRASVRVNATADYRNHTIDESTYRARVTERGRYLARPKTKPDAEGHLRLQCPAAGSWPEARCDLKPASLRKETARRVPIPIAVRSNVGSNPPPSCTQHSVTLPPEAGAKY